MNNDSIDEWMNSVLLFVAYLAALLVISEVAFTWIPRELHQQVGGIWVLSGVGMMFWGKYGYWDD